VQLLNSIVRAWKPLNLQFSKLWRHFLWLLGLNACGSTLSIVAWVARYQQKVFSFASNAAPSRSAEYWSFQVSSKQLSIAHRLYNALSRAEATLGRQLTL